MITFRRAVTRSYDVEQSITLSDTDYEEILKEIGISDWDYANMADVELAWKILLEKHYPYIEEEFADGVNEVMFDSWVEERENS